MLPLETTGLKRGSLAIERAAQDDGYFSQREAHCEERCMCPAPVASRGAQFLAELCHPHRARGDRIEWTMEGAILHHVN